MGQRNVGTMNAVDFFCGGGGITRGLLDAGVQVIFGVDSNPHCQSTYENNNHIPFLCRDILDINGTDLINEFPILADNDNLLMVGCAPCQPFSILRPGSPNEHVSVNLLNEFGRIVEELRPAHIMMENVPTIRKRGSEVLNEFIEMLKNNGYDIDYGIINAKNYGVPQNRRRFILIASRLFEPQLPPATHGNTEGLLPYETVYNAISHFPPIEAGEEHPFVANHRCAAFRDITLERIISTPHDGGSRLDWPTHLILSCHREFKGHTDVYGRMFKNRVAPTLTVKCFSLSNGRFGHPEQNRAISLREAAAIQTFPDNYIFVGNMQEIGKQIGNAVPVLLSRVLGQYIMSQHEQFEE